MSCGPAPLPRCPIGALAKGRKKEEKKEPDRVPALAFLSQVSCYLNEGGSPWVQLFTLTASLSSPAMRKLSGAQARSLVPGTEVGPCSCAGRLREDGIAQTLATQQLSPCRLLMLRLLPGLAIDPSPCPSPRTREKEMMGGQSSELCLLRPRYAASLTSAVQWMFLTTAGKGARRRRRKTENVPSPFLLPYNELQASCSISARPASAMPDPQKCRLQDERGQDVRCHQRC